MNIGRRSNARKSKKVTIPLNHVDYLWLVMEDLMPSMGQVITLRFTTALDPHEVREALRQVLHIYPRLRHLVKPGLCSYRLELIDTADIDDYLCDIVTVERDISCESEEYLRYRRDFLNHGFKLERELPIRAVFFPDNVSPILLLSLHHITCDGMGWRHLVGSLMAFLNGKSVMPLLVEDNRIYRSFLERPFYRVPSQLASAWKNNRENIARNSRGVALAYPIKNPFAVFGPTDMHEQDLGFGLTLLKDASRRYDCTVTVLFMAALAMTMRDLDVSGKGDTAHIHFLIDLRPHMEKPAPVFGNYIISGLVRAHAGMLDQREELVKTIKGQLEFNLEQVKSKNIIIPILINGLIKIVGRRLSVRIGRMVEKKGKLSFTTVFSNMGNLGGLNTHGSRVMLRSANATVSQQGIFFVTSCIGDVINMMFSYPEREVQRRDIKNLIGLFERNLKSLLDA